VAARIKKGGQKSPRANDQANLRLVVKIARDYEGIGLPSSISSAKAISV